MRSGAGWKNVSVEAMEPPDRIRHLAALTTLHFRPAITISEILKNNAELIDTCYIQRRFYQKYSVNIGNSSNCIWWRLILVRITKVNSPMETGYKPILIRAVFLSGIG